MEAFLLVVVVALLGVTQADLPIHCLNKQVAGKWRFELSDTEGDKFKATCGYNKPDNNKFHFGAADDYDFESVNSVEITLDYPNIARTADGEEGEWTMVYDEGISVDVGGQKYFAFHAYDPKEGVSLSSEEVSDYISHCDATRVGWMHSADKMEWGCWKGQKVAELDGSKVSKSEVDTSDIKASHIVNPDDMPELNSAMHARGPVSPIALETRSQSTDLKPTQSLVSTVPKMDDSLMFEPDYAFIETQNSDSQSTWSATAHDQFVGKRMSDMNKLLGTHRFKKARADRVTSTLLGDDRSDDEKYADIPKKHRKGLDWRDFEGENYDTPVRNQGGCGSCYAVAAMSALEARFKYKSGGKDAPRLSAQDVLSCSATNQGCEGGYPFLVAKHGEEFGFISEDDVPYQGSDTSCTTDDSDDKRYKVKNSRYVGGYYGGCNEVHMMKELLDGPIMVAFEAPGSLFVYSGGIFKGERPKKEPNQPDSKVKDWQQTNHAVVCVGWGTDEDTIDSDTGKPMKYWIIKNTWGQTWGEEGYFRIRRGTDECGIESMAVTADVVEPNIVNGPYEGGAIKGATKIGLLQQKSHRAAKKSKKRQNRT